MSFYNLFHKHRPTEAVEESKYWYSSDCAVCGKHITKSKYGERGGSWNIPRDIVDSLNSDLDDGLDTILGGLVIGLAIVVWAVVILK